MIIRKAKVKDIPEMVPQWLELMDHHIKLDPFYYRMSKNAVSGYKKWVAKCIRGRNSTFLIAEEDGNIIGHIGGSIETRPPCLKISKNGFVLEEIVTKKYRNKGVGKRLENELLKWFKGKKVKFVELRTHSKNKKTIAAWEKMGFKENLKIMLKRLK